MYEFLYFTIKLLNHGLKLSHYLLLFIFHYDYDDDYYYESMLELTLIIFLNFFHHKVPFLVIRFLLGMN